VCSVAWGCSAAGGEACVFFSEGVGFSGGQMFAGEFGVNI
jgi:hypothetical protein